MVALFDIILFLLAALLAIGVARVVARSLPRGARGQLTRAAREARVPLGRYTVRDLMESMLEQLFASALPSIDRSYVPNVVTFGLHPADAARWGGFFADLERELATIITARVDASERLQLSGPLSITLTSDERARPGRPTFTGGTRRGRDEALWRAAPVAEATGTTGTLRADAAVAGTLTQLEPDAPATPAWTLIIDDELSDKRVVRLRDGATVGRAGTADVRIHGRGASREHAEFGIDADGALRITDLGSVNGTFVDGRKVQADALAAGQQIRFGRSITAVVAREDG